MNIFGLNITRNVVTNNGVVQMEAMPFDNLNDENTDERNKHLIDCSTIYGRSRAYRECNVVRTVLGKSSSAIANLKVYALDEDDKEIVTPQAKTIIAKLNRPNPKEDFKRFFRKLDLNCKLHGKAYVHKQYSELFNEYNYYVIPNAYIAEIFLLETDELFNRKVDYFLVNDGTQSYQLSPKDVHIFYDGTLDEAGNFDMMGGSRLESLSEVISTYVILWEALTEMYGDRGALNIISMGARDAQMAGLPALKSEREALLKRMSQRFGLRRGQAKNEVITTDAKVSPVTAKMSDMEFEKTIIQCLKAIANAYDCPAVLLDIESARFKNSTEAMKILYTQSAIPTAEYYFSEWCQMIGETLLPFSIRADYSHLEFYQEGKKEEAIAFQQMSNAIATLGGVLLENKPVITNSEARLKLDLE